MTIQFDRRFVLMGLAGVAVPLPAWAQGLEDRVAALAAQYQPKVVAWRRDIHQNPELSNREVRTGKLVAKELKRMGLSVRTGLAGNGVVGVLKGGKPGPAVALRADMDALPVEDKTGEPFASKAMGEYEGKAVPVTHACGHDAHVAMLLGAAEVLSQMKADIAGDIVFIFQPAEEGPPKGEEGGADVMIRDGALSNPAVKSIFGIHVWPGKPGELLYRPEGFMAQTDRLEIQLKGVQTHGSRPWDGVDITALAADITQTINQITSRRLNITKEPTVVTISIMEGGLRYNIIPETLRLAGTMRTFSKARRDETIDKVTKSVELLAQSYGATAKVEFTMNAPLTYNDPQLSKDIFPVLVKAAGEGKVSDKATLITGGEDFAEYQKLVPGVFCFLGIAKPGEDPEKIPPNHSPYFNIYEPAMEVGVRAHALAALFMLTREASV
jgi:amidohydrolase